MKEFFRPLNLSQNLIEYDWILWPIEQIWTGSDSLGAFSEGKWRFLDKWHAELWRTLQVLTFQAKPGKEFNWILDFTKDLEFNFTFAQLILVPQTMLNKWPNRKLANLITILGPFLHFFLTIYHSVWWSYIRKPLILFIIIMAAMWTTTGFFFKSDFRNHDIIASQHHIATLDSPEMNYIFLAGDAIHYTVVPHILSKWE